MGFLQAVGQASPAILSNIGQMKQMAIQDQQEKREAVKFDYLQKKMAEEEADANKLIPVSLLAGTQLGQKYPTAFNTFLEHSRREGALVKNELAGEEMIRKKDLKGVLSGMNLTNEAGQAMMKGIYQDAKMRYMTLLEQKNSGKLKKPEELEALKQAEAEYLGQASLMDEAFQKAQIERQTALYKETIKPPDVQDIQVGRNKVQAEWDPMTRTRKVVGGGPMDAPEKPVLKETADGKIVWVNPPSQQGSVATPGGTVQGQPPPMVTEVPGVTVKVPGKTDDQRIVGALTQKLGRAPTDQEVLDEDLKRKASVAEATVTARNEANSKSVDEKFTPEAIEALADRFIMTGELPGMGMGKAATIARTKVLNRYAEKMAESGKTSGDQVIQQAGYRAGRTALAQLESQKAKILAFASTADKNLGIVEELSVKVGRTGIPVINKWLVMGKKSIAGDPDVSRLDAAMRTAINEYAKVTSSATGGGVTSDQARKEIEDMLNSAQTTDQVKAVVSLLRQEMQNRKLGYDEQVQSLRETLTGVGKANVSDVGQMKDEDLLKALGISQ